MADSHCQIIIYVSDQQHLSTLQACFFGRFLLLDKVMKNFITWSPTKEVNNDDNLAYLIVAKEASLPCDGTSKWCASRCRSHTCTKITSNVMKYLHKNVIKCRQIPAQKYPKMSSNPGANTFPQIFATITCKYIDIYNIRSTHKCEIWQWDSSYDCWAQKISSHSQDFLNPPKSRLSASAISNISTQLNQTQDYPTSESMESTLGKPLSLDWASNIQQGILASCKDRSYSPNHIQTGLIKTSRLHWCFLYLPPQLVFPISATSIYLLLGAQSHWQDGTDQQKKTRFATYMW